MNSYVQFSGQNEFISNSVKKEELLVGGGLLLYNSIV